jgi:hypothetical protein
LTDASLAARHHDRLLRAGRCGQCAEPAPRPDLLRGRPCGRCGAALQARGGADLLVQLETARWFWRVVGYGMVAAASFVAGMAPLAQVVVQALGIAVLHVLLLRRGLAWLPRMRRMMARFSLKLLGSALTVCALLVNILVIPLLGVSGLVLAGVGLLFTAIYVEAGLLLLRRRHRWEQQGLPLKRREWVLPAGLLGATLVGALGGIGAVAGSLHLLSAADIPRVSDVARWLLEG